MNPWDGTNMNEREYFNWLRSATRRIWTRHPQKNAYKKSLTFKAPLGRITKKNPKGMVNACKCEMCGETFKSADLEVDHIIAGGSFKNWKEYTEWARRILWVTSEDIRLLCKGRCHQKVTYSQRYGVSLEEAEIMLKVNKATKQSIKKQKEELTAYGFGSNMINNATNRRRSYVAYYTEEAEKESSS